MALTYSIALDLEDDRAWGEKGSGRPTPSDVFGVLLETIPSMGVARAGLMPSAADLAALWNHTSARLVGTGELSVEWEKHEADGTRTEWSLRIEHPDNNDDRLVWTTDFCLRDASAKSAPITMGIRVDLSALQGGARPFDREPGRPRFVANLLERWRCSRGGLPLTPSFADWEQLPRLRSHIADPQRELPVLLAGPAACIRRRGAPDLHDDFKWFDRKLHGVVALAAIPTLASATKFNAGLDRALRFDLRNPLAIYWPIERGSRQRELASRIEWIDDEALQDGPEYAADRLLSRVASSATVQDAGRVVLVGELRARRQEHAVRHARSEAKAAESLLDEAKLEREFHEAEKATWEATRKELDNELARTRSENIGLQADLRRLKAQRAATTSSIPILKDWQPGSVVEALAIAKAMPGLDGRIVFTSATDRGAKASRFEEPGKLIEIISFLVGPLLDEIRSGRDPKALEEFSKSSGLDLAMRESSYTRAQEQMMKERDVVLEGTTYRCEPHFKVGAGSEAQCLRVHYCVDGTGPTARIILGYVGYHLTTRQTARQ